MTDMALLDNLHYLAPVSDIFTFFGGGKATNIYSIISAVEVIRFIKILSASFVYVLKAIMVYLKTKPQYIVVIPKLGICVSSFRVPYLLKQAIAFWLKLDRHSINDIALISSTRIVG